MRYCIYILLFAVFFSSCKPSLDLVYRDMQNFSVKQEGLKKTTLCMDVRMYNPNVYNVKLRKAKLNVYLNDNLLGCMKVNGRVTMAKQDTSAMPVSIEVDLGSVLPSMMQVLTAKEVSVKLKGSIKAGRRLLFIKVPVDYESKQDIRKYLGNGLFGSFR